MSPDNIIGVVLAGGRSSRMGQPKCQVMLAGQSLLFRVVEALRPQVSRIVVNTNLDTGNVQIGDARLSTVSDCEPGFPGPLTGLVSAFQFLEAEHAEFDALAIVPCDGPFLPANLVAMLAAALEAESAEVACVRYQGKMQPTFSLWRRSTAPKVTESLKTQGSFKYLFSVCKTAFVDWPETKPNPFFNINTPEELALAENYREAIL